jgi:hypothetical protein
MTGRTSTTCHARAIGTKRVSSQSTENLADQSMPVVDVTRRVMLVVRLSYPGHPWSTVVDPNAGRGCDGDNQSSPRRDKVETIVDRSRREFDDATFGGKFVGGCCGPCTSTLSTEHQPIPQTGKQKFRIIFLADECE